MSAFRLSALPSLWIIQSQHCKVMFTALWLNNSFTFLRPSFLSFHPVFGLIDWFLQPEADSSRLYQSVSDKGANLLENTFPARAVLLFTRVERWTFLLKEKRKTRRNVPPVGFQPGALFHNIKMRYTLCRYFTMFYNQYYLSSNLFDIHSNFIIIGSSLYCTINLHR